MDPENAYFFELFWEVSALRTSGDRGIERIQPLQITTWSEYTGRVLEAFEKKLLIEMDAVFVATWREENALVQEALKARGNGKKTYSE